MNEVAELFPLAGKFTPSPSRLSLVEGIVGFPDCQINVEPLVGTIVTLGGFPAFTFE